MKFFRRSVERVHLEHGRGAFDQPLHQVGRFRPAGAAIRRHRRGIGEHALGKNEARRNIVDAGQELDREHAGGERRRGNVRADGVHRLGADSENLSAVVERDLAGDDLIAAMGVAGKRLRARRRPFHRTADALATPTTPARLLDRGCPSCRSRRRRPARSRAAWFPEYGKSAPAICERAPCGFCDVV